MAIFSPSIHFVSYPISLLHLFFPLSILSLFRLLLFVLCSVVFMFWVGAEKKEFWPGFLWFSAINGDAQRGSICGVVPGEVMKEGSDSFIIAGAFELNKFIAPVNALMWVINHEKDS